jgi:DNA-binding IclR family transcriptional regulator
MYSLGLYLMTIGRKMRDTIDYETLAGPFLRELSKETSSTAALALIAGENRVVITRQEYPEQIHILSQTNTDFPLTYGAHGKAIVAFLEAEQRERILSREDLYFYKTPQKLNRRTLAKELIACRKNGYAMDYQDKHPIVKIIAAPFFDTNQRPLGVIQIIGIIKASEIASYGAKAVETARRFTDLLRSAGVEA